MFTVGMSNHGSFLSAFFKGSAYIVDKLVMHPCVPLSIGAPLAFLVDHVVYRAHRLKSTAIDPCDKDTKIFFWSKRHVRD